MYRLFFLVSVLATHLNAATVNDTSNVLVYGDTVQVSSEVNISLNLKAGQNIPVSIMVTHDKKATIDTSSFKLGNKVLIANFVQNVEMPSNANLIVSVYHTNLEGMPAGNQILPPISVKVNGKDYLAPPLTLIIDP